VFASLAVAAIFWTFAQFDRVLRAQHAIDLASWTAEGSPCGFFWLPCKPVTNAHREARLRTCHLWVLQNPAWANGHPHVLAQLRRYRIGVALWFTLSVTTTIVAVLWATRPMTF
jgi:hypothetical protein